MVNYQLYHTNPKLSGQVKWDLIISKNNNKLVVDDFHLSPISDKVPYNYFSNESLLNYSHQENVSRLYKQISGYFYQEMVDYFFTDPWPIISDDNKDTHFNTYEMGLKRMRYELYHKQFEFLVPIWIEYLNGDLSFDIEIWTKKANSKDTRLSFYNLSLSEIGPTFHNDFCRYFKNYIQYIGLDKGNNKCLSIHLDKSAAQISGICPETGLNNTLDISTIVPNLLNRERPLLEFDNLIINQYIDHNLIAPQLLNFNICFNLEDMIPAGFYHDMLGAELNVKIFAKINEQRLPLKDFYSNYEYIPRQYCGPSLSDKNGGLNKPSINQNKNVLDYLKDYRYKELLSKNKINQSTIHWSLIGNNEYILNLYNGFKGYIDIYDENGNFIEYIDIPHSYNNSPDILDDKYEIAKNNIGWCNYIDIHNIKYLDMLQGSINQYIEVASDFTQNWVNNIKYLNNTHLPDLDNLKVLLVKYPENEELGYEKIITLQYNPKDREDQDIFKFHVLISSMNKLWEENINMLFILSNDYSNLTFSRIKKILGEYFTKNDDGYLEWRGIDDEIFITEESKKLSDKIKILLTYLYSKMISIDTSNNPPVIVPNSTVDIYRVDSPSLSSQEIGYYKNDRDAVDYMLRYSGMIRPMFIDEHSKYKNYLYFKDWVQGAMYKTSPYMRYSHSGFLPEYPSLDYFSILHQDINYQKVPELISRTKTSQISKFVMNDEYEYKWFNDGKLLVLESFIEFNYESKSQNYTIDEGIIEYLMDYYQIDREQSLYIKKLYNIDINFEYAKKDDIDSYIYHVELKLK